MYAPLAAILVALAGCAVLVARRSPRHSATREQLCGFLYVGASALVVLAVAVVVIGSGDRRQARAEGLAVFGLFTYLMYVLVAAAILWLIDRPERPGRSGAVGQRLT